MKLQQQYSAHEGPVNQVAFHPSGSYLVSVSQDTTIKIFDLLNVKPVCTLYGHGKAVQAVVFSPQGEYFASGGQDGKVMVWKSNINAAKTAAEKENVRPAQRSSESDFAEKRSASTRSDPPQTPGLSERVENLPAVHSPPDDKSADIVRHLSEVSRKLDTLTQTVLIMEKRLCLVEEQIKIVTNSGNSST
jgi:centriolar protein POC1